MLGIVRRMKAQARQKREWEKKRDRMILEHETFCGANASFADAWFRAEKEFDLDDEDAYECIKRLRTEVEELKRSMRG